MVFTCLPTWKQGNMTFFSNNFSWYVMIFGPLIYIETLVSLIGHLNSALHKSHMLCHILTCNKILWTHRMNRARTKMFGIANTAKRIVQNEHKHSQCFYFVVGKQDLHKGNMCLSSCIMNWCFRGNQVALLSFKNSGTNK